MIVISFATFVWGVGTVEDSKKERLLDRNEAAVPRLVASVILAIGMYYLFRIILSFKYYGAKEELKSDPQWSFIQYFLPQGAVLVLG